MAAATGDTVAVHYTGVLEDGSTFDTSEGREPIRFTLGAGDVIPGFEQAVVGLEPGQTATVTIQPEDAYGPRQEGAAQTVPVEAFGDTAPPVGARFTATTEDGVDLPARVVALSDDEKSVVVDFNHPLAGRVLTFQIQLVEIVAS